MSAKKPARRKRTADKGRARTAQTRNRSSASAAASKKTSKKASKKTAARKAASTATKPGGKRTSSRFTAAKLREKSAQQLGQMAKKQGVPGWHSMRKEELVAALVKCSRNGVASAKAKSSGKPISSRASKSPAANRRSNAKSRERKPRPKQTVAARRKPKSSSARLTNLQRKNHRLKDLAGCPSSSNGRVRDRLVLMVRDPYWLHVTWELSRGTVDRAQAALGKDWHAARPVLRLLKVAANGGTSTAETVLRDIPIHGGVNNWYVEVTDPPMQFQVEIGYATDNGRFFALARSNAVTTPRPGAGREIDANWNDVAENFEKIYAQSGGASPRGADRELTALFEERLRRPMTSGIFKPYGANGRGREFTFEVDAELIIYGSADPGSRVTLHGEPVELRPDGTFTVRYGLPNCRQVIPVVALSGDGVEQRTIVLAIERNTKTMEPVTRELHEL